MILKRITLIPFALLIGLSILFVGCGTDSDTGSGTMTVEMADAPIDSADAVNVFIESVEVNREGSSDGWVTLNEPQQEYDLLELTNGATTIIGSSELEAGTYQQIRLILSQDGHSVEVDGRSYDMKVPSGPETGIKLNINAEIQEDIEYVLLLDFDASRSVVKAGQNNPAVQYLLKPVISATEKAITGNIEGTVDPFEAQPVVYAIAGSDTLTSTIADTSDGYFKLIGLEEGTYDVSVNPRNDTYSEKTVTDVDVTVENTSELGTIELPQN
ncbi:hypothetical protein CK503_02520 [Aliifodinibius salipaludis]|uniref:DUF4382 domain-containing protein n=1 Tax=Fodinibius salipaludis TaxID=2032627 RepID=A0A2A2GDX4_9BACT|nr:DUF4382 domain-containing protein [Aliifodinibius salipaludis]PAU95093.1 hypothetical protein CK503_02520 [Aliifodinibius salipaludis]